MALPGFLRPTSDVASHGEVLKREDDLKTRRRTTLEARDQWGTFFYPTRDQPLQVWKLGDDVTLRFETGFASYTMALWQQSRDGSEWKLGKILLAEPLRAGAVQGVNKTTSLDWTVQIHPLTTDFSYTFLLRVNNGSSTSDNDLGTSVRGFTSPYFNIVERDADTSSVSVLSTSVSAPTSASASASATSASTIVPTGEAAGASQGAEKSNVTAIALGTVLGIAGLAALLALFFWLGSRRRKRREKAQAMAEASATAAGYRDSSFPSSYDSQGVAVADVYKPQVDWSAPQIQQPRRPVELGT
ncbi:hypothetical protein QBC39DRAFT_134440 [Podospora conica]|nr:hypothetical protein QBC39DRAFT_134440 [Schizothecium conicum]